MSIITRIAPTPSGYLHLGNAYNFLLVWLLARTRGGKIRLRIDDLDSGRVRQRFLDAIFYDLEWLGIDWDDGPTTVDQVPLFAQHSRMEEYMAALGHFREHRDVFGCVCTRKMIRMTGSSVYQGTCVGKPLAENTIWRLHMKGDVLYNGERHSLQEEYVMLRSSLGIPTYQLACVVDDYLHGVNLIVRGQDLFSSSLIQTYLREALEISSHPYHFHHDLLLDESGQKLSKSTGSLPISAIREQDKDVVSVYHSFANWRGWNRKPNSIEELCTGFREEDAWSHTDLSFL